MSVSYSPLSGYLLITTPHETYLINTQRVISMSVEYASAYRPHGSLICLCGHTSQPHNNHVSHTEKYRLGTSEDAKSIWTQITSLLMEGSITLGPSSSSSSSKA